MNEGQMELFAIDETAVLLDEKELDEEGLEIFESLKNARAEARGAKALEDDAKRRLLKYLGGAEVGTIDGEPVVKVSTIMTERPDWDSLKSNPIYAAAIRANLVYGEHTRVTLL